MQLKRNQNQNKQKTWFGGYLWLIIGIFEYFVLVKDDGGPKTRMPSKRAAEDSPINQVVSTQIKDVHKSLEE